MANVPYADATSGARAQEEIKKLLQGFGCDCIGFMDDYRDQAITLGFIHRGRRVEMKVSANGWAAMYMEKEPWSSRRRGTYEAYKEKALAQGMIAINSVLRDWVKGLVTAVECEAMPFEHIFLPFMLTANGKTVAQQVETLKLLPEPA